MTTNLFSKNYNNLQRGKKMKFIVNNLTKCAPRLGTLRKELSDGSQINIETPFAMLYTRGGSIPHITYEVFQLVCNSPHFIQIPIASTYHFQDAMNDFEGNISDFVGLSECLTCIVVQDPGDLTQPGHHYKDFIPLWTRAGKVLLNSETYMKVVSSYKPDMFCLLSDSDTNIASSKKRLTKAVDNTLEFFKQCMDKQENCLSLQRSLIIASISGGYNFKQRERCLEGMLKNDNISGYSMDGLHNNGPEAEFIRFEEIQSVTEFVLNKIPEDKLRAVYGCWNPVTLLHLVEMGMDVFDTSYCHIVTERSSALTFSFVEPGQKYEINLREQRFVEDFSPLLEGCTCLTCTKHTRGYIHHLITAQELLGPLLLTIHNIHHYLKFFYEIRESIKNETLDKLREIVKKQFIEHQDAVTKNKHVRANSQE